jgi:SAM-dependent methyltransferase
MATPPRYVVEFGRDSAPAQSDGRLDAPAFHRNHAPIWSVLSPFLTGQRGDVIELGSGTGQHVVEFARHTPDITWWPSDLSDNHLKSIAAWRAHAALSNVREAARIDLYDPEAAWQEFALPGEALAIFCANVIHIAPWTVAEGLFALAARRLKSDGRLFLYGPFMWAGQHTAPSNAEFDASLRARNPDWGVRDVRDLDALAATVKLQRIDMVAMPANNFVLVFERVPR